MWPFKSKPYELIIHHSEWCDYNGEPGLKILRSVHKQGKRPLVEINCSSKTPFFKILPNGDIMIYRGLPIWQGSLFTIKVKISK